MSKTTIHNIEAIALIAAIAAPVHYLAGLDWAWSIVLGAAASVVLRALIRPWTAPPTTGERN